MPSMKELSDEQGKTLEEFLKSFFTTQKRFLIWLNKQTDANKGILFEDVVQEGELDFSKAFHNIKSNPIAYFKRCLINANNKLWRKNNSEPKLISLSDETDESVRNREPSSTSQTEKIAENANLIKKLFSELKKEEQNILVLKYGKELSDKELAAYLGVRENTATQRKCRILVKCRNILGVPKTQFRKILKNKKK